MRQVVGARKVVLVTFPEAEGFGLTGRVRKLLGDRLVAAEESGRAAVALK